MILLTNLQSITPFLPLFLGISLIGFTCGTLGTILFLKKESMVADAISHAMFPGITLTFLCTQTRSPIWLFLGGVLSGTIALFLMMQVVRITKNKKGDNSWCFIVCFFWVWICCSLNYSKTTNRISSRDQQIFVRQCSNIIVP